MYAGPKNAILEVSVCFLVLYSVFLLTLINQYKNVNKINVFQEA